MNSYFRLDSLSLFLHLANLGNASNVLVFENCAGLLIASILVKNENC